MEFLAIEAMRFIPAASSSVFWKRLGFSRVVAMIFPHQEVRGGLASPVRWVSTDS
jgi:hypothetical protein